MTDSPMVSERAAERAAVLRERMADAKARCAVYNACGYIGHHHAAERPCETCVQNAALKYPLPKVPRPRKLTDSKGVEWRLIAPDRLQFRYSIDGAEVWRRADIAAPASSVERALLIADLHGCPTEWVEEEG